MIRFWCECGRQLQARFQDVGRLGACPLCMRTTTVPDSDQPRRQEPAAPVINVHGEIFRPAPAPVRSSPAPVPPISRLNKVSRLVGAIVFIWAALLLVGLLRLVFQQGTTISDGDGMNMLDANNLKQMALALHNHQSAYDYLPAAAAYRTKDGKPGLSWRVALLPFLEQDNLFKRFKLDEPWNSEHNLALLAKMPAVYWSPWQVGNHGGWTHYRVFGGTGSAFEPRKDPIDFRRQPGLPEPGWQTPQDFPDGPADTILIATARIPVPWTMPDDLAFDPAQPLPQLGARPGKDFRVALGDGSVRRVSATVSLATLRAAITRNGGERLGPDW